MIRPDSENGGVKLLGLGQAPQPMQFERLLQGLRDVQRISFRQRLRHFHPLQGVKKPR
jgi:hypothetical protein